MLINKQALAKLTIDFTPLGMRAFMIKFDACIGAMFSEMLEYAIQNNILEPTDARTVKLHKAIYNLLVPCFGDRDDILMRMTDEVGPLGPGAIV